MYVKCRDVRNSLLNIRENLLGCLSAVSSLAFIPRLMVSLFYLHSLSLKCRHLVVLSYCSFKNPFKYLCTELYIHGSFSCVVLTVEQVTGCNSTFSYPLQ